MAENARYVRNARAFRDEGRRGDVTHVVPADLREAAGRDRLLEAAAGDVAMVEWTTAFGCEHQVGRLRMTRRERVLLVIGQKSG